MERTHSIEFSFNRNGKSLRRCIVCKVIDKNKCKRNEEYIYIFVSINAYILSSYFLFTLQMIKCQVQRHMENGWKIEEIQK